MPVFGSKVSSAEGSKFGSIVTLLVMLVLGLWGSDAFAQSCDCEKPVGQCSASINVIPTDNGEGRFGANLEIKADAKSCAKVEYYVDNTPYVTVLRNGKFAEDRVLGISPTPITSANVQINKCTVCRDSSETKPGSTAKGSADSQKPKLVDINPVCKRQNDIFGDTEIRLQNAIQAVNMNNSLANFCNHARARVSFYEAFKNMAQACNLPSLLAELQEKKALYEEILVANNCK